MCNITMADAVRDGRRPGSGRGRGRQGKASAGMARPGPVDNAPATQQVGFAPKASIRPAQEARLDFACKLLVGYTVTAQVSHYHWPGQDSVYYILDLIGLLPRTVLPTMKLLFCCLVNYPFACELVEKATAATPGHQAKVDADQACQSRSLLLSAK